MTCKDCIHYEVCNYHITEETPLTVDECSLGFKNKADFVEVVRCKDCAYRYTKYCNAKHERADMDYCSSGDEK